MYRHVLKKYWKLCLCILVLYLVFSHGYMYFDYLGQFPTFIFNRYFKFAQMFQTIILAMGLRPTITDLSRDQIPTSRWLERSTVIVSLGRMARIMVWNRIQVMNIISCTMLVIYCMTLCPYTLYVCFYYCMYMLPRLSSGTCVTHPSPMCHPSVLHCSRRSS